MLTFADLEVHFLDVGQGDCTVVLCDGQAMVIDGGPAKSSSFVYSYLRKTLQLTHLDYVISTHPHLDHVHGLSAVLNAAQVDLILTPILKWDSKAFESMLKYALTQGHRLSFRRKGRSTNWAEPWSRFFIAGQRRLTMAGRMILSIVTRINYGETSFMITGDAEDWSEYMMVDSGLPLRADVLRVGITAATPVPPWNF